MAKGEMGGSKTSPDFLVLLLIVLFSGTSSDPHSLSDNVTIDPCPRDDQPLCEVQEEIDQKVFVSCDYRKDPLNLQANVTCWRQDNGHINGSCKLGFNGQLWLSFNLDHGRWIVHHRGGKQMKGECKNDGALIGCFNKRDCLLCNQTFSVCSDKMSKTMVSQTTGPSTVQNMATASKHITWILPVVLTSIIITVFLG